MQGCRRYPLVNKTEGFSLFVRENVGVSLYFFEKGAVDFEHEICREPVVQWTKRNIQKDKAINRIVGRVVCGQGGAYRKTDEVDLVVLAPKRTIFIMQVFEPVLPDDPFKILRSCSVARKEHPSHGQRHLRQLIREGPHLSGRAGDSMDEQTRPLCGSKCVGLMPLCYFSARKISLFRLLISRKTLVCAECSIPHRMSFIENEIGRILRQIAEMPLYIDLLAATPNFSKG